MGKCPWSDYYSRYEYMFFFVIVKAF
jgi:hypothetical protein